MPTYRNDDDIHRYQPLFIEMRGWLLPVQARYASWIVWGISSSLLFVTVFARTLGAAQGAMYSAAAGGGIAWALSGHITNEVSLIAWYQAITSHARSWLAARRRSERLAAPTVRHSAATLHAACTPRDRP